MVIYYNSYCTCTHRHILKLLEGFFSVNHAVEFSMSKLFQPQNAWPTSVSKGAQKQNCMHHHSHSHVRNHMYMYMYIYCISSNRGLPQIFAVNYKKEARSLTSCSALVIVTPFAPRVRLFVKLSTTS